MTIYNPENGSEINYPFGRGVVHIGLGEKVEVSDSEGKKLLEVYGFLSVAEPEEVVKIPAKKAPAKKVSAKKAVRKTAKKTAKK